MRGNLLQQRGTTAGRVLAFMILSKADDDVSVGFDLQQGATCDERAGGVKGSSERGITPLVIHSKGLLIPGEVLNCRARNYFTFWMKIPKRTGWTLTFSNPSTHVARSNCGKTTGGGYELTPGWISFTCMWLLDSPIIVLVNQVVFDKSCSRDT